uniref:C2H2-type domain-containing protein n=1 Tax=Ditylenchus dipsaci TaxID=166011 RepID=A0A915D2R2_9BILA
MDYTKLQNCLGELRKGGANSWDEADEIEMEVKRGVKDQISYGRKFYVDKNRPAVSGSRETTLDEIFVELQRCIVSLQMLPHVADVVRSCATNIVTNGIAKAECLLKCLRAGPPINAQPNSKVNQLDKPSKPNYMITGLKEFRCLVDQCSFPYSFKKQEKMIGHIEGIHRQHTWLEGEEDPNGQEQTGGFGQDAP